ncbi:hypothetical protein [Amycolatopsis sp. WAC 04169]|nr:hypothetical protein [Amycolatopsis sp. WAC 04169]
MATRPHLLAEGVDISGGALEDAYRAANDRGVADRLVLLRRTPGHA